MRLLLGIILLIICVFIGYIKSNKYYLRKTFYIDFVNFNNTLKEEVFFRQGTIIDLLKKENSKNDFYKELNAVFIKNEKFNDAFSYLDKDEITYFKDYVNKIGAGDNAVQIKFLEGVSEQVEKKQNQSFLDNDKYKKLYIKLGFFIGLILFILVL